MGLRSSGTNFTNFARFGAYQTGQVQHTYTPHTALIAGGVLSGTVSIVDDAVARIKPDRIGGMLFVNCMGSGGSFPNAGYSGCGYFDVGATPSAGLMFGGANFEVSASVLDGNDGVDGKVTMGVDPATNEITLENRSASSLTFNYTVLG